MRSEFRKLFGLEGGDDYNIDVKCEEGYQAQDMEDDGRF